MADYNPAIALNIQVPDAAKNIGALSDYMRSSAQSNLLNTQAQYQQNMMNALQDAGELFKRGDKAGAIARVLSVDPDKAKTLQDVSQRLGLYGPDAMGNPDTAAAAARGDPNALGKAAQYDVGAAGTLGGLGKTNTENQAARTEALQARILRDIPTIRAAGPEGSRERLNAWNNEINRGTNDGLIDPLAAEGLRKIDPNDATLDRIYASVPNAELRARTTAVGPTDKAYTGQSTFSTTEPGRAGPAPGAPLGAPPAPASTPTPGGAGLPPLTQQVPIPRPSPNASGPPLSFDQRYGTPAPTAQPFATGMPISQVKEQEGRGAEFAKMPFQLMEQAEAAKKGNMVFDQMKMESKSWRMGQWANLDQSVRNRLIAYGDYANAIMEKVTGKPDFWDLSALKQKAGDFGAFAKNAMVISGTTASQFFPRVTQGEFNTVKSALPSPDTPEDTFKQVADQFQGGFDLQQAELKYQKKWYTEHGTMEGFMEDWNQNADYFAFMVHRMDPKTRTAFLDKLDQTDSGRTIAQKILTGSRWAKEQGLF